jgi:Fe-S oxidoreductase
MSEKDGSHALSLKAYEDQLWSCLNCFCGLCVESCPAYRTLQTEAVTARGFAQIGLALISGEIEFSELSDEVLYGCIGCRWCETVCSMNTPLYIKQHGQRRTKVSGATMAEIFRSIKISETGKIPLEIRNALVGLAKYGNPYGVSETLKDQWVSGLDLGLKDEGTILFVGATVPYDDKAKKMAEAVVELLRAGGIRFSLLGSEEKDSGAFARMIGEEWLFSDMVAYHSKLFHERHVTSLICLSPHDYDTFLHYYEDMADIRVKHYTEILWELMEQGGLTPSRSVNRRVTYHDPCYLGRQNEIYEEPRKILGRIPGLRTVEMKRCGESAWCCGGGGTGLFLELPHQEIDKARVDQAKEVNPDYLAVACPNCYQMLDSAIKGRQYAIEVKDIAEIVIESL